MIYKMTLKDSVDTMTFNLLETPIVDKDIEGAVDNVTLDGNQYTDYLYLKKQYIQKWAIMCPDEYDELRGFYTRQFEEGEVPSYRVYYGANVTRDYTFNGDYFQFNAEGIETGMTLSQLTGNAEQETTTGKNLLNYGQLTYSFPANANTRTVVGSIDLTAGTTYYFTYNVQTATSTSQRNTPYLEINGTQYYENTTSNYNKTTGRKTWQYVAQTTGTYAFGYWCHAPNVAVSIANFMASISSDSTFEPYTAGASPNPSYPQDIEVVTGEQTVTATGKNWFNFQEFAQDKTESSGVTRGTATATDNSITLTATGNDCYTRYGFTQGYPPIIRVLPNTNYTLSWQSSNTSGTTKGLVYIFGKNTSGGMDSIGNAPDYGGQLTFNTGNYTTITFRLGVSTSGNSLTYSNIQLELGSQKSNYEPYQGQSYDVNLGKNLLPPTEDWSQTINDVAIDYEDGIFTFSGTATANASTTLRTATAQYTIRDGDYLHYNNNFASSQINIQFYFTDGTFYATSMGTVNRIAALDSYVGKTVESYRLNFNSGYTFDGTAKPMIVHNVSTPTSYAPYSTPIELAKVGTYQDRIYKDDGKWYIEKQVGKVVLDGTENWALAATYTNCARFVDNDFVVPSTTSPLLCDYFTQGVGGTDTPNIAIHGQQRTVMLTISKTIASTVDAFKAWLASTNPSVYYALATPTTTEITDDTLLYQLNFLASLYKGENNISLVGTGAQGEMEVFIRDVMSVETDVVPEVPVRLTLTDDGVINACGCRRNVQLTMRETTE